jgi:hypothetical protein
MKGKVILRILAQELLKSELRLRRYGKKNFRHLFVISKKWLGLIWNYFSNSKGLHENLWTAGWYSRSTGAFLQSGGNKGIHGFNLQREIPWTESTVRWTGGALGSMVDRGRHGHWARWRLSDARRAGARSRRSSPVGCNRERGTRGSRWAAHQGAGGSVAVGRVRIGVR